MRENTLSLTRGNGYFESYLAKLRARMANMLIPQDLRNGRILDIGCGTYPYFLSHTYFKEKHAIDRLSTSNSVEGIQWLNLDLNKATTLPYKENYFSVVTLLAVIEHLDPEKLSILLQDTYRILTPNGRLIMTTPASWSDGLLKFLAKIHVVSKDEIDEHVYAYTLPLLGWYLGQAGFKMSNVNFGYFEFYLNLWATASK